MVIAGCLLLLVVLCTLWEWRYRMWGWGRGWMRGTQVKYYFEYPLDVWSVPYDWEFDIPLPPLVEEGGEEDEG